MTDNFFSTDHAYMQMIEVAAKNGKIPGTHFGIATYHSDDCPALLQPGVGICGCNPDIDLVFARPERLEQMGLPVMEYWPDTVPGWDRRN